MKMQENIKALLNSIDDLKMMKNILIECGVFVDKSAAVLCIEAVGEKANKVSKYLA